MSENKFFNWLNSQILKKKHKKLVILGGAYSEVPDYYVKSNWHPIKIAGQNTKIRLVEDTQGDQIWEIDESFEFNK